MARRRNTLSDNFKTVALTVAKADIGLIGSAATNPDTVTYLDTLYGSAVAQIQREGITLAENVDDETTVGIYIAYLYRKRAEDDGPMPRNLRWRINNRLMSEKAAAEPEEGNDAAEEDAAEEETGE